MRRSGNLISSPASQVSVPTIERGKNARDRLATGIETRRLDVDARRSNWIDSGIEVHRGDTITIQAKGYINHGGPTCGPDGNIGKTPFGDAVIPNARYGALIGRIGSGDPIIIGSHYEGVVSHEGGIKFLVNDTRGLYNDNSGEFHLQITISSLGAEAP